ncbi:DUF972 family protein [Facklamia sp. DSM 111018]|uniref:DUF972 family protein n=1 Tax=Facklamia lactis TaxID=2749967 RepID=A0ABS0LSJ8_9LACT|nr:initiation control protein YabA [Facklamia lactis]MBG9981386.1 DUF972 family protein [Facklamia lactis]MBG9987138.1 DUF972 family protein [Facklamia lactis]
MANSGLEDLLNKVQEEMNQLRQTVALLVDEVERLTAENNRLRIQQYKAVEQMSLPTEKHQKIENTASNKEEDHQQEEQRMSSGQARLQSFYNEGIHICHHYFGSQRNSHEECIFCQDIIDSLGDKG